ncbi:hypothetical protein ACVBIO_13360 [Shewanella sp. 0m-8]
MPLSTSTPWMASNGICTWKYLCHLRHGWQEVVVVHISTYATINIYTMGGIKVASVKRSTYAD